MKDGRVLELGYEVGSAISSIFRMYWIASEGFGLRKVVIGPQDPLPLYGGRSLEISGEIFNRVGVKPRPVSFSFIFGPVSFDIFPDEGLVIELDEAEVLATKSVWVALTEGGNSPTFLSFARIVSEPLQTIESSEATNGFYTQKLEVTGKYGVDHSDSIPYKISVRVRTEVVFLLLGRSTVFPSWKIEEAFLETGDLAGS